MDARVKPAHDGLGFPLLGQRHDIARAGDALRPGAAEVGDQLLEFGRAERRVASRLVGEAIDRIVHARLDLAPETPGLVTFENPDRPRQVVVRIPGVEFIVQMRGDDSADKEVSGGGMAVTPSPLAPASPPASRPVPATAQCRPDRCRTNAPRSRCTARRFRCTARAARRPE
jgi:hypothetical protein